MKVFSNKEIETLYEKHITRNGAYFDPISKKDILSLRFEYTVGGKTFKYSPENHDFPRIKCLLDLRSWLQKYNINNLQHCLFTDYLDPEINFLDYKEHTLKLYNFDTNENDLHTMELDKDRYDFVLFNQTIEHLYNPFMAVENLFGAVKPGGYIFTSVPTINIPHMTPFHFNGYSPIGLCILFESAGFNTLEIGFWGNYRYINTLFKTHKWPDYRKLLGFSSQVNNEPRNVAQTWILAQKPVKV